MFKRAASRLFIAEKLTAEIVFARPVPVTMDVGEKLNGTDLEKLSKRLNEMAALDGNLSGAKSRSIIPDKHDEDHVNDQEWDKDLRALRLAAGFFSNKQSYLPYKLSTIENRLRPSPLWLTVSHRAEQWLKNIRSLAQGFLTAIKKLESVTKKSAPIQQEFDFNGYHVINAAGLPDDKLKPFLGYLKEASNLVPSNLTYGNVRITTSRETDSKTLAYYVQKMDTMALLIDVKSSVSSPIESIVHELGHRLWYKFLDSGKKEQIGKLFNEHDKFNFKGEDVKRFLHEAVMGKSGTYTSDLRKLMDQIPAVESVLKKIETNTIALFDQCVKEVERFLPQNGMEPLSIEEIRKQLAEILFISPKINQYNFNGVMEKESAKDFLKLVNKYSKETYKTLDVKEISNLVVEAKNGHKNLFPSEYSKEDVEEFFAVNFAHYCLGKPISDVMSKILQGA